MTKYEKVIKERIKTEKRDYMGNRMEKIIKERVRKGNLPTAYDCWDRTDREIAGTLNTKPYDHTKRGGLIVFEK